jgi:predicted GH43/DUF377 family glycosyl hydrolase
MGDQIMCCYDPRIERMWTENPAQYALLFHVSDVLEIIKVTIATHFTNFLLSHIIFLLSFFLNFLLCPKNIPGHHT